MSQHLSGSFQQAPLHLTCSVRGCFLGGDDLQQLHLVHGGEVVHAYHLHNCSMQRQHLLFLCPLSLSYTTSTHRTLSLSLSLAHTDCDINAYPLSLSFPSLSLTTTHRTCHQHLPSLFLLLSLSHNHTQNVTSTLSLSPLLSLFLTQPPHKT